ALSVALPRAGSASAYAALAQESTAAVAAARSEYLRIVGILDVSNLKSDGERGVNESSDRGKRRYVGVVVQERPGSERGPPGGDVVDTNGRGHLRALVKV